MQASTTALQFDPTEKTYRCRLCSKILFAEKNVIPHEPLKRDGRGGDPCTSYFLDNAPWVEYNENDMKLNCFNPKCKAKLGEITLSGRKCSCGQWVAPAIQVNKANVDQMLPKSS